MIHLFLEITIYKGIGFHNPVFSFLLSLFEFLAGLGGPSGIAHFAHVGGFVVGYVYLKWGWKVDIYWQNFKKGKQKRKYRVVKPDTFVDRDLKEEVDHILDKVSKSGLDSLTAREKKILQNASKHLKKRH